MTVSYRRRIHYAGMALIFAAALVPALGLPYLLGAPFAIGAVALLLGGEELLRKRAERALQALGSRAGSAVHEHKEPEHSDAWLRERGFADLSVWVVRAKSVDAAGGTASIVEIVPSGPGRPTSRASVISAPARALDAGAVSTLLERVRAIGGTDEIRFAAVPGRASVLVHGAPAELFAPDAFAEIVRALDGLS